MEGLKPAGVLSFEDAAERAMAGGDVREAAALWRSAVTSNPQNMAGWLKLAACHRALGDLEAALIAVDGALVVDPRMFVALLMKASLLERAGRLREAGPAYGTALLLAPPDASLDPPTLQAVKHGRVVNAHYGDELGAFLKESVKGEGAATGGEGRRIEAFIDFILGRRKNYRQDPVGYFYPGLPAIEFWEREEFPWLEDLEASTDLIRGELAQVMAQSEGEFVPYINYADSLPLDNGRS